jgi:hypothetical protein
VLKSKDRVLKIVVLILFIFSMVLYIILSRSNELEFLAFHSKPVCSADMFVFTDSVCASCGQTVENTGYFRTIEDDTSTTKFSDRYSSYKDYKGKIVKFRILSVIFCLSWIALAVLIIIVFKNKNRKDRKE